LRNINNPKHILYSATNKNCNLFITYVIHSLQVDDLCSHK